MALDGICLVRSFACIKKVACDFNMLKRSFGVLTGGWLATHGILAGLPIFLECLCGCHAMCTYTADGEKDFEDKVKNTKFSSLH